VGNDPRLRLEGRAGAVTCATGARLPLLRPSSRTWKQSNARARDGVVEVPKVPGELVHRAPTVQAGFDLQGQPLRPPGPAAEGFT
jgi:hypothetical protein